jgi:hypothetical protein
MATLFKQVDRIDGVLAGQETALCAPQPVGQAAPPNSGVEDSDIASSKWHPTRWLAYFVGALTLYWVLGSIGSLLKQVQRSGSDLFGGMESLGSGLLPMPAVQRTQSLLQVWHESSLDSPGVGKTIWTTSVLYTTVDLLLIVCYVLLLRGICRWLVELKPTEDAKFGVRWQLFQRLAGSRAAVWLPVAAGIADLAEDGIRFSLIWNAFRSGDGRAQTEVVTAAWIATTTKFGLLVLSVVVILLLIRDRGVARGHFGMIRWALWRLRIPIGATLVFVALLLGDPTGQAADLIRRWIDSWPNALIGVAAIIGAGLLGFTVWLITRRIVLSNQDLGPDARRRQELAMTWLWLGVGVVTMIVAIVALDWKIDPDTLAILTVAVALLLAAMFLPGYTAKGTTGRIITDWRTILLVATVTAWIVSAIADWQELRAPATVASVVLVLETLAFLSAGGAKALLKRIRSEPDAADQTTATPTVDRRVTDADCSRLRDTQPPDRQHHRIARRTARVVAVAAPVALLITAAGAFAPVPLVLYLSGSGHTDQFRYAVTVAIVLVAAPAITAIAGYAGLAALDRSVQAEAQSPKALELGYKLFVPFIVLGAAFGLIGGAAHWPAIGPLSIVAAFLATAIIVLGEAQLRSETHRAPPSFLLAGFTRVPPVTLIVITSLLAGFAFSDGSGHIVFKTGTLPAGLVSSQGRVGIDLRTAFQAWATHNCADEEHRDQSVPMILVSAPGGGLRAAYWTASTLTEIFGPTAAPGTSCPGAAPADRVFAVGGASGGSLGELAWIAGLDHDQLRAATWYEAQLARPDFLSDPLSWLLTVDLIRGYLGFHGQDRARRLENRWSENIRGLNEDFLTGSWGFGGNRPLALLTGTQVETGCRLNISGVRVTDATVHEQESSCTTVHEGIGQMDAPATSDVLDYLCGPVRGSTAASVSRSTAALLSARFPWVSPSGQLDRCAAPVDGSGADATRIAVVDGGYADNTGMGLLLDVWPRLEQLIAEHNSDGATAQIVPVFLEVDNHYAAVAAPAAPDRTAETLVPPLTKNRPDQLDDITMRARIMAAFAATVPGTPITCNVDLAAGRYVRVSPKISPGLPAPLAWTLSEVATQDLRSQRTKAMSDAGPANLGAWVRGEPGPVRGTPKPCGPGIPSPADRAAS